MATIRQKTIKVPVNFGSASLNVPNNTLTTIGTPTIYIPENADADVTFKSAMLFFSWQDVATTTGNSGYRLTQTQTEITLENASAANNITINAASSITNTNENMSFTFGPFNYTDYFNDDTAWDSSRETQTCLTKVLLNSDRLDAGGNMATTKIYGWFDLTYEYDADAGVRRIQTVCLPMESYNTYMPTSLTEMGTLAQLTGAGGILAGYNSPIVRHRWVEIKGNSYVSTRFKNLQHAFDGGPAIDLPPNSGSLSSGLYERYFISASHLTISESHTFEMASTQGSRWPAIVFNEWLSFEYTTTDTTKVLNYLEMPLDLGANSQGVERSASSFTAEVLIPESNITQSRCAVEYVYGSNAGVFRNLTKIGVQDFKEYFQHASVNAGALTWQHRFDTGSSEGQGMVLQSGMNKIDVEYYQSALKDVGSVTGIIKLLYLSDVDESGIDNHSQTARQFIRETAIEAKDLNMNTSIRAVASFNIPNSDYYLQAASITNNMVSSINNTAIQYSVQILPSDSASVSIGRTNTFSGLYMGDNEQCYTPYNTPTNGVFRRYPFDMGIGKAGINGISPLDITSSRAIDITSVGFTRASGVYFVGAYSGITRKVSGSIANSSNGTSSLSLYEEINGKNTLQATSSVNGDGVFEFTVYNPHANYQVSSYIGSTTKEISKLATPGEGFNIDYASGGGGGGEFFF